MTAPTIEQARAAAEGARGSRVSALIFDPVLWWAERSGMREHRRRLVAGVEGA